MPNPFDPDVVAIAVSAAVSAVLAENARQRQEMIPVSIWRADFERDRTLVDRSDPAVTLRAVEASRGLALLHNEESVTPPASQPTKLVFVRHGDTQLNEDGDKIRGWVDVPLSPKGKAAAIAVGQQLADTPLDGIISSDLGRARETAGEIAQATGAPILYSTQALRPLNAGIFQGVESKSVLPKLRYFIEHPDEKIPGGESFNDFKSRFLDEMTNIHANYPGKTLCIVAHHRNDVALDAWTKKGQPADFSLDVPTLMEEGIAPGAVKTYELA
ncbi:MAG TPA: histidine phosphatase family protein [Tepidisphaeraceae bacterium]|nr:histidine phosphatase family protein [Tepidisphaeraceae bacterium]